MEQTTLYYRSGSSDKIYTVILASAHGGKYSVNTQFGRRGSAQQTGTKTPTAVLYGPAKALYERLIKEKKAKGYTVGEAGVPYQHTSNEGRATGIQCQLLNPIDSDDLEPLLLHPEWWMQEKLDGQRRLIQKIDGEIIGINRRELQVTLPATLVEDGLLLPNDCILDGEAIGDELHVFDLLRLDGEDLRSRPYLERYLKLMRIASAWECQHIHLVQTACTREEKHRLFDELIERNAEGVVFKNLTHPYTSGRPNRWGPALKYKFHETASFVVNRINEKRSVSLMLFDGGKVKPAGNVTIPINHKIPSLGNVVEVRYLYAYRDSGCIYQPVYLGVRDDIIGEGCTVDQLKYKPDGSEKAEVVANLPLLA